MELSMYVNSLACIRVKGGESECLKIHIGVGNGCIMSPWLFNVYMDAMIEVKMGMRRMVMRFLEEGRREITWSLVYKGLGFVWWVGTRLEVDGEIFCWYLGKKVWKAMQIKRRIILRDQYGWGMIGMRNKIVLRLIRKKRRWFNDISQ